MEKYEEFCMEIVMFEALDVVRASNNKDNKAIETPELPIGGSGA